jgi:non-ribosomal peptide synthetase component F
VDFFDVSETPANIDLTLNVENTGNGMRGQVLYSTDLFKRERITRLIEHFQLLLGAALRDPEVRLGALRLMLAEAERARLAEEQEEFQRRKRRTLRGRSPEPVRGTGAKGEADYEQPAV